MYVEALSVLQVEYCNKIVIMVVLKGALQKKGEK